MEAKEKVKNQVSKEEEKVLIKDDQDQPEYQEKIMFLVSTTAQGFILFWCLVVLSLGYVKLPTRMFGMDIPDQPRIDSTFAAGLLGNILAGWGISVGANNGKKKKKEGENGGSGTAGGFANGVPYTIIKVETPIKLVPDKPRIDPISGKEVDPQTGKLT